MVGVNLVEIREHIETLASADGTYYIICGRTGDRPVPAVGKRFDSRTAAQAALRATEQYRTALRRYDPQVPYYDLVVCQEAGASADPRSARRGDRADRAESELRESDETPPVERRALVECCHRLAASVFETLSASGFRDVETAVMDTYFDVAERIGDPDDLCLCLVESMAMELETRLTPDEQAEVIAGAAARLTAAESTDHPVAATLSALHSRGLFGAYTQAPSVVDLLGGTRSTVVRLSDYVLSPREGRLPVLPIVLELYRREPDWHPTSVQVAAADGGWQLTLVLARDATPTGLASVPIRPEVP